MILKQGNHRFAMTKHRTVPFIQRIDYYVSQLSLGDRFIFFVLAGALIIFSFGALFTLEKSLLVEIPAHGGTLTEGVLGSPRFVNPLLAITDADRDLTALTYAGLMGLSPNGDIREVLAESYEISEDGREYTFVIKEDAVFSDGTSVTAGDVVFTIEKAQDPAIKSPVFTDWNGVIAEAVDSRTVRFTLQKPYAPFLENLTLGILPKRLWSDIFDEEFPFVNLQVIPVGAGPFVVKKVERNSDGLITSYKLSANKHYVLGKPYLSNIKFVFFSRTADLVGAIEKGLVDSAYGVSTQHTLTAPYARIFGVFFNSNQNQLFTHIEVRKALSVAVDRNGIVENVLGGYATAIMGPVPPGSGVKSTPVAHNTNLVTEAANILQSAGWTYNADARAWKKKDLSLQTLTIRTSNVPELKAMATAVKENWEKLGVTTDIELYEPGDLNQNVIRPRKYEALLFGMVIGQSHDLYAFWHSAERNDPGLNIALYTNKNIDSLLEEVRATNGGEDRIEVLQKINDIIADEYPAAFIQAPDFVYTVPEALRGVLLPQITTPADRFAGVEKWHVTSDTVWPVFVK